MLANNHWRDVDGDLPQRDYESPRDRDSASHCSLSELPTANMDYDDYYSARRGVPEWAWWCFLDILSIPGQSHPAVVTVGSRDTIGAVLVLVASNSPVLPPVIRSRQSSRCLISNYT